jgi:uncharacterized CHY-type Zn-finger protein
MGRCVDRTHYAMHCEQCDRWEHLYQCFDLVSAKKVAHGRGWTYDERGWICPECNERKTEGEDHTTMPLRGATLAQVER